MRLSAGNGGWLSVEGDELALPGRIYVRVQEVDGIDRVTELYIDGRGKPIQPGALRRFPLALLESALVALGPGWKARRGVPGPDLSRLASYFSHTWGTYRGRHCEHCSAPVKYSAPKGAPERAIDDWVALAYLSQFPDGPRQPPVYGKAPKSEPVDALPELHLSYESGQALSDAFLSDVARAYEAAIARGRPPAVTIAEMVGVEQKTVQSWIWKARRRGIMPPAKSKGRIV